MRRHCIILALIILTYFSCFGQNIEIIKGKFEYSSILNDFIGLSEKQKMQFVDRLNKLDTSKINEYFKIIFTDNNELNDTLLTIDSLLKRDSLNYAKAEELLNSDSLLKGQETRMIAALYTCCILNKKGLLDYYYINLVDFNSDGTKNIFLTKEQLKKIKPMLGKEIELTVQYVTEAKWTKFKVYKLKDKPSK